MSAHILTVHIEIVPESALECKSALLYDLSGRSVYGLAAYLNLVQIHSVKSVGYHRLCCFGGIASSSEYSNRLRISLSVSRASEFNTAGVKFRLI